MARRKSKAAYFLVDLTVLSDAQRREIIEDAVMGGGEFGVRVVEEVVNGPATSAIYGVYFGPDEQKWADAQKEFGAEGQELSEEELEAREEALRSGATRTADAAAARQREAEEAEVRRITKESEDAEAKAKAEADAKAETAARDQANAKAAAEAEAKAKEEAEAKAAAEAEAEKSRTNKNKNR